MIITPANENNCGCCEGVAAVTPRLVANRPGLPLLVYRVGFYSDFLETMQARLSQVTLLLDTGEVTADGKAVMKVLAPLAGLRTRAMNDPAVALLDAWAVVADALTFYQERIANEGYLRTATERRSILELGRLVGYQMRPGVAASTYLAFTLQDGSRTTVRAGTPAQTTPSRPDELPQVFETSTPLEARAEWNQFRARQTQPQYLATHTIFSDRWIWVKSVSPGLKVNDALLLEFDAVNDPFRLYRVLDMMQADPDGKTMKIKIQPWRSALSELGPIDPADGVVNGLIFFFRYYYFQANRYGISASSPFAQQVMDALGGLLDPVALQQMDESQVVEVIQTALPMIAALKVGLDARFNRLIAWSSELSNSLSDAAVFLTLENQETDLARQPDLPGFAQLLRKLEMDLAQLNSDLEKLPALQTALSTVMQQLQGRIADLKISYKSDNPGVLPQWSGGAVFTNLLDKVTLAASIPPFSPQRLTRASSQLFSNSTDLAPRLLSRLSGAEQSYAAWSGATSPQSATALQAPFGREVINAAPPEMEGGVHVLRAAISLRQVENLKKLWVMRVQASLFGGGLPGKPHFAKDGTTGAYFIDRYDPLALADAWSGANNAAAQDTINLDKEYNQIKSGSWLAIYRPGIGLVSEDITYHQVTAVASTQASALGVTATVTRLELSPSWLSDVTSADTLKSYLSDSSVLKQTRVWALSELVEPVEEPTPGDVTGKWIELDSLIQDLQPGRWLVVSGERVDLPGKVISSELAMLEDVMQDVQMVDEETALPGDKPHSFLTLARDGLAYLYRRGTVKIFANVVDATQGVTRTEPLGSGDAGQPFQTFSLRQPPLTFVPAATASGIDSTLEVRVNNLLWHESTSIADLGPADRGYTLRIDDDGKTSVIFGDDNHGGRLPTGVENIRAVYRKGIGKGGNVITGAVNVLLERALGVKDVINPLPGSGGADRESGDSARKRVPLALMALDRLVSVQDYEDFTRVFAGISKSSAVRLSDGYRQLVHITIAGEDDIPILTTSKLYSSLLRALSDLGDPFQPFRVDIREKLVLVLDASVHLFPDYLWEAVEPQIRAALVNAFGFEARELGQDVTSSEVLSVIQAVEGVDWIDLDVLDAVGEQRLKDFLSGRTGTDQNVSVITSLNLTYHARLSAALAHPDPSDPHRLLPAQIACLDSSVLETVILKVEKSV